MDIQVDATRVITVLQDELSTVTKRLVMTLAVNAQLTDDIKALRERIREAEERILDLEDEFKTDTVRPVLDKA